MEISGKLLRDGIISGAHNIINNKNRVDELNVFPVPDGDTGTNMSMTIRNALSELEAMDDSVTVSAVSSAAASGMLRGARGNSGVILSLFHVKRQRRLLKKRRRPTTLWRSSQRS